MCHEILAQVAPHLAEPAPNLVEPQNGPKEGRSALLPSLGTARAEGGPAPGPPRGPIPAPGAASKVPTRGGAAAQTRVKHPARTVDSICEGHLTMGGSATPGASAPPEGAIGPPAGRPAPAPRSFRRIEKWHVATKLCQATRLATGGRKGLERIEHRRDLAAAQRQRRPPPPHSRRTRPPQVASRQRPQPRQPPSTGSGLATPSGDARAAYQVLDRRRASTRAAPEPPSAPCLSTSAKSVSNFSSGANATSRSATQPAATILSRCDARSHRLESLRLGLRRRARRGRRAWPRGVLTSAPPPARRAHRRDLS